MSPGVFIPAWDDGRVAVGNGDPRLHWVHDDVRARALRSQRPGEQEGGGPPGHRPLHDLPRRRRRDPRRGGGAACPPRRGQVEVFIGATHNHHGPDTAFDVNHSWYDSMIDRAAAAVVEAVARLRPARLRVGQGRHWFGMDDGTDPQVIDPRMNVLQATGVDGRVIGTVIQWNNHPETTLGWEPPVDISRECAQLGWTGRPVQRRGPLLHGRLPRRARPHGRAAGRRRDPLLRRRPRATSSGRAAPRCGRSTARTRSATSSTRRPVRRSRAGRASPTPTTTSGGPSSSASRPRSAALKIVGQRQVGHRPGPQLAAPAVLLTALEHRLQGAAGRGPETGYSSLGHVPRRLHLPGHRAEERPHLRQRGHGTEEDPIAGTIRKGDHLKSEVSYLKIGSRSG